MAVLFSKKRTFICAENRGEMSYEGSPVKAPPRTRRTMMPPTPQQISHWSTRERRVVAGMENNLDKFHDTKVELEALELLMDPEDSEVLSEVCPDACKNERQQDSRDCQYKRENSPLSGKHKPLVGVPRKEGRAAREVAKRFARRELRRNDGKGSSVHRKKDEDAAAAGEFFVDKGGRKPVECSRKDGYRIAGQSLEGNSRN